MPLLLDREPYAYRQDPAVPAFDDSRPIAFVDGHCALCTRGARLVARFDRAREIRICRIQSPLGTAVLEHFGLAPDDAESWLFLADGRAYGSLDAMIRAGARIGGIGWLLQIGRLLPSGVQDRLYRLVARNRYDLFGRADICAVPDPELRARLME